MKTKLHYFRSSQKGENFPGRIGKEFKSLIRNKDFWFGSLVLVLLLLLFGAEIKSRIPDYELGEIAHSTVRAPFDAQVPDTATTEQKRLEAKEAVPPVFDYESGLVNSSASRMNEVFSFIRDEISTAPPRKAWNRDDWIRLSNEIKSRWKIVVEPEFLKTATGGDFSEELQGYLIQKLRWAMSLYIVADQRMLESYENRGITVRTRETGREDRERTQDIYDISGLRQIIQEDLESDSTIRVEETSLFADFIHSFCVPTIYYNSGETESRKMAASRNTEPVFYQVKKGKVIVRDGEEVTPVHLAQLKVLREETASGLRIRYSVGVFLLLVIFLVGLKRYLGVHQFENIKLQNKALFPMCSLILLLNVVLVKLGFLIALSLSSLFSNPPFHLLFAYQVAVPFAVGALMLTILADKEISAIYSLTFSILIGVLTRGDFFLAFYCLIASVAATFSIKRYYQRSALLRSIGWVWLANFIGVLSIHLILEIDLAFNEMLFYALCALLSATLSAALASVLSPLFEWMFNIVTDIKLLELSNLDLPILRQLALEAPGTYHHSIVMGTIAEAAAEKVGANPLFLRVAALYHDIGKIRKSEYYVENQREDNKHDALNPRMSALVIINHVKEGQEVAKMLRLPPDVADMIPQHHGTRLITYFYKKAKDMENPEMEEVKESDYRYPGPKPQTKEAAILMLADATEAASRTITEPTPTRLRNMVQTLFRAIFEDGQLNESNLMMKDLNLIAEAFVRKLESVFHHRISYPGYEFNKDESARDSSESQNLPEKMAY